MQDEPRNSLVQVVECVGDADGHLHSGLRGQFLNSCISFFPKGLRVVLIRQTSDVPLLENSRVKSEYSQVYKTCDLFSLQCLVVNSNECVTLKSLGKTSVGCPLITNRREFSLRRLESKSSRLCSKNLEDDRSQAWLTY